MSKLSKHILILAAIFGLGITTQSCLHAQAPIPAGSAGAGTEASKKDWIDYVTAFGTILAGIAAAVAASYAGSAAQKASSQLKVSSDQTKLTQDALRAQSFLGMIDYERAVDFTKHMDIIRSLDGRSFDKLEPSEMVSIGIVVNFFNHLAYLIRHKYLTSKEILLLYSPSLKTCRENLTGQDKWLDGFRKQNKDEWYYLHFEFLCKEETIQMLWSDPRKVKWPSPYKELIEPTVPPPKHRFSKRALKFIKRALSFIRRRSEKNVRSG
jgi:hypothetical protein